MIPCAGCPRCETVYHQLGDVEYVCMCPDRDHCERCNRDDVPKLYIKKVKE